MYFIVRSSDRLILSYGESSASPTAPAGAEVVTADGSTSQRVLTAYQQPNGGVTLAVDGTVAALPVPPPDPVQVAAQLERTTATSDLAAQYAAALARLDQIIAATSPTNAQVVAAVQDLATIQKRVLRLMKAALT